MQQNNFLPAVERTLQLIELIAQSPQGITPQELVNALDVPRSTLFQILKTLKKLGYIEQIEKRGRYRSGPRLEMWANTASNSSGQDLIAAFYNEANRFPFSETIVLINLMGNNIFTNAQVESQQVLRSAFTIGQWEGSIEITNNIFSPAEGHEIIENGVAVFHSAETWECAAPICQDGVTPNAALLISAPHSRWTEANFRQAFCKDLRSMASRLSYQIGAQHYYPYHHGEVSPLQVTTDMNLPEINNFLQGPWSARLACIRPDGRPHVVPVWQEWDGKQFTVLAWKGSHWANHLIENPNVSLTIDEPWPPFHRVVVRGTAKKIQQEKSTKNLVEHMSKRYMGSIIPQLVNRIESAFIITPDQVKGWKGMANAKND
ncbi:MAG: pyridoxamine 5'-phosphate oxidase family protein [Anaerolineaceae bacterium]|nr:pyridoxamine 5'-phosphate oxidase family protein [Anaerolineaceae bacterium]